MKYCINGNEGKLGKSTFGMCRNCLLEEKPEEMCGELDICTLNTIISKSENTSLIFTL